MKKENLYTPDCIRTFSGKYVNVFEPTSNMICIEDIAHALSHQCRFAGHTYKFYSVAEHSVLCSNFVLDSKQHAFAALMHDASEAFLVDIPSPIKKRLLNYKELEDNLMALIAKKYGFQFPFHPNIKEIDEKMLQAEWETVVLKGGGYRFIKAHDPATAKQLFLNKFNQLFK